MRATVQLSGVTEKEAERYRSWIHKNTTACGCERCMGFFRWDAEAIEQKDPYRTIKKRTRDGYREVPLIYTGKLAKRVRKYLKYHNDNTDITPLIEMVTKDQQMKGKFTVIITDDLQEIGKHDFGGNDSCFFDGTRPNTIPYMKMWGFKAVMIFTSDGMPFARAFYAPESITGSVPVVFNGYSVHDMPGGATRFVARAVAKIHNEDIHKVHITDTSDGILYINNYGYAYSIGKGSDQIVLECSPVFCTNCGFALSYRELSSGKLCDVCRETKHGHK